MTQHIYNIINIPNNKWKQNANKKEEKEGKTKSTNRTRLFREFLCHSHPLSLSLCANVSFPCFALLQVDNYHL